MATKSEFSVGLADKWCGAWANAGGTPDELNVLAQDDAKLRGVLSVLRGQAEVAVVTHVVDCDVVPFIPEGWEYKPEDQIASRVRGKSTWNPAKVAAFLADGQKEGRTIKGDKLREELEGKPVLPANLLDYLIDHPWLIPESWKGKLTFFWGSLYRNSGGSLFVRCMCWGGARWYWLFSWLGGQFDDRNPAAVSAS